MNLVVEIVPAILVPAIRESFPDGRPQVGKDIPVVPLSFNEYLFLDQLITFLGIVVCFPEPGIRGSIMFVILNHVVTDVREHLQHL